MAKNLFMLYFNPYALGAPAFDDLSVFEKKEDSFILSKLVYHFTMVTLQKHYTNNPTTKNTFIIAHVVHTYGTGGYLPFQRMIAWLEL